jgi:hypothetical protein
MNRDLSPAQVRDVLSQSVASAYVPRSQELGFGRLDMGKLASVLRQLPPRAPGSFSTAGVAAAARELVTDLERFD